LHPRRLDIFLRQMQYVGNKPHFAAKKQTRVPVALEWEEK